MEIFAELFGKKRDKKATEASNENIPLDKLMTSQFPALYIKDNNRMYRDVYLQRLMGIGFKKENAEKMFNFECDIIRRYGKQYLQNPNFTKMWFFNLNQPLFQHYPNTKEDIIKEKYLTMSEICKIIDEAEWHFWNSHEKKLSDSVWAEIYEWRLKGKGAEFASEYFVMIENATGIPRENIGNLCALQGEHLSKYKWE